MSAPQGQKISPAGVRKRKKATVKIRRNPLLRFLHMIPIDVQSDTIIDYYLDVQGDIIIDFLP